MGHVTFFEYDGCFALLRVTLSDGTMIEGDALPKLDRLEPTEWRFPQVQNNKNRLAKKAYGLVRDAINRNLTDDDVAVLMARLIQGQKIDGYQVALFVKAGMYAKAQIQRSKGGSQSKLPQATIDALNECLISGDSNTDVIAKLQRVGIKISRPTIVAHRKKRSASK